MSLKLYHVSFIGTWPVGAYATVIADSKESAKTIFLEELKKNAPSLYEENVDMEFNCIEQFMYSPGVYFHSYGEY